MIVGFDIGGTNLRAAAFEAGAGDDGERPVALAEHREPIGEARDPVTVAARIADIASRLVRDAGGTRLPRSPIPLGVGIAAILRDRRGTVANSPHLRWHDVRFGPLLAARLGPAFALGVYNDANAIAWGEHLCGAAYGVADALVVYAGTGIGGGVIANGRLVEGSTAAAGEIGHVKVRWDEGAALCACGSRGCFEAYAGGSYVARRIASELGAGAKSAAIALAGGVAHVTPSHVDAAAAAGDDWALSLWTELAPLCAVALGNAIAILNPARLVLGGGLFSRTPMLLDLIGAALAVAVPPHASESLDVAIAELGDDAGLLGAARLAADLAA
ncbi:MAG TPA: ROK family protein [Kofleriaceae bacterium]|jgi:glucokinase